jgi:tRNA-binding EMAP/Myf-like protein
MSKGPQDCISAKPAAAAASTEGISKSGSKQNTAAAAAAAAEGGKKGGGSAAADGKKEDEEAHIGLLDIRVGTIVKVDKHPNADALYLEEIDLGEERPRQVRLYTRRRLTWDLRSPGRSDGLRTASK